MGEKGECGLEFSGEFVIFASKLILQTHGLVTATAPHAQRPSPAPSRRGSLCPDSEQLCTVRADGIGADLRAVSAVLFRSLDRRDMKRLQSRCSQQAVIPTGSPIRPGHSVFAT